MEDNKTCSKCGHIGKASMFRNKSRTCKKCYGEYSKSHRLKNLERNRLIKKEWNKNNRPKVIAYSRNATIKKYGLTVEEYQNVLISQDSSCLICKKKFADSNPCIDHCHTTGKFRSLLCSLCNSLIGYCNEDIEILESAIKYLKDVVNPTLLAEEANRTYYNILKNSYNR